MNKQWLDANVILRFLLNDHPEHSLKARELIEEAPEENRLLQVPGCILCEVIYVLEGLEIPRSEIGEVLLEFSAVQNIQLTPEEPLLEALVQYRDLEIDFPDLLLMSLGRTKSEMVWSFNKNDFQNLAGPWSVPGKETDDG